MTTRKHQLLDLGGTRIHAVEEGSGPLVLLVHGFPESWYSWRHQLGALAKAGYRAVAIDQRGYGRSSKFWDPAQYRIGALVQDAVGVVRALGEKTAVIVGHDWGAPVAWHAALLRPDVFRAVAGLSVPFLPRKPGRAPIATWKAMQARTGGEFYMVRFAQPGSEAELDADVPGALRRILAAYDGATPSERRSNGFLRQGEPILDAFPEPERLPPWLSDEDFAVYVEAFTSGGFGPPFRWYRNLDRNFELGAAWQGKRIEVPGLFAVGENDPVRVYAGHAEPGLKDWIPDLRGSQVLHGAGHWLQQERPDEVNRLLIGFLRDL
jgi:pimeloyl-ACP methyl ester carboxylesterase